MNSETVYARNADLMVAEMDDDLVMMDVAQGSYFSVNRVGAHIWTQLEEPQSIAALVTSVGAAFASDDTAQIQGDVEAFLTDLAANKIVRETGA